MDYHRLANTEAELWHPPPARWLRYQGKQELRHPDAVRHAVDRAAASAWEHIPPVFRPFIADRLACLGPQGRPAHAVEVLGPRIVLAGGGRQRLARGVSPATLHRRLHDGVRPPGRARRHRGGSGPVHGCRAIPVAGVAAARGGISACRSGRDTPGSEQAATSAMAKAILAAWGIADPDQIRHRRRHLSRASRLWATTP